MALTPFEVDVLGKYVAGVAVDLTKRLLDAAGNRVKRLFQGEPQAKALGEAINEGLAKAQSCH